MGVACAPADLDLLADRHGRGGEQRISNFLLWQLAYTECYFTDELWPDFDASSLDRAITSYRDRERRFGRTSEQVAAEADASGPVRESGGDFS